MATPKGTPSPAQLNQYLESLIPAEVREAAVPLVLVQGSTLTQFGTGTLLRIADESFVVTASHVISKAEERQGGLCIAGPHGSFVPLAGEWLCSAEGHADVAVARLAAVSNQPLAEARFLRYGDVSMRGDLSTGVFVVFGYPSLWSEPSTSAKTVLQFGTFQYVTYPFDGETAALGNYERHWHLLLTARLEGTTDLEGKPVEFRNRQGFPARFPRDLGGISGCSVWKVGDLAKPLPKWKHERPKLVGVQTGVYDGAGVIKATRWAAVVDILYQEFTDLRPALELWRAP
jgi:hypothetical protein